MTASGKTMNLMTKPIRSQSIATHLDYEQKKLDKIRKKNQTSMQLARTLDSNRFSYRDKQNTS